MNSSESVTYHKHLIDCSKLISPETPSTKGWLEGLKYLSTIPANKAKMTNKKILEGILQQRRHVVAKISNQKEDLIKEYNIFLQLKKHNVTGIVHYYCYFECDDDVSTIAEPLREADGTVCKGPGSTLRVLLMEYIRNKNLAEFHWKSTEPLIGCIKQVLYISIDAFLKFGFVHGDLHCKNILIKSTKQTELNFRNFLSVPSYGFKVKLMDFELSKTHQNITVFYKEIYYVFWTSVMRCFGEILDRKLLQNIFIKLEEQINIATKPDDALQILQIINILS